MTGTQVTAAASILWVLLSGSALAQPGAQHAGEPLLSILRDRECVQRCSEELSGCLEMARQELADCGEPCAGLRAAARAACMSEPSGEDCRERAAALRECIAPCAEKHRAAVADCYASARGCIGECPPAADLSCARRCQARHWQCRVDARRNFKACRERCGDLIAAARRACTADPASEACARDSTAARHCLTECIRMLRSDLHECQKQLRMCLADCETDAKPPATMLRPAR